MIRRVLWISWLWCALIVAASLDRVPDPPAVEQRTVQLQSVDHSFEPLPLVSQNFASPDPEPEAVWPAPQAFTEAHLPPVAPLMRQAADSSPPSC